jgi:molybdopterin synthase sulfur carrier subunit
VKILYFAWVRQKVGKGEEDFSPPADVKTVAGLIEALRARGDRYSAAFADTGRIRAAVNQNHVDFDAPVGADDEVAFFPPVTGGTKGRG